jgi:hypothetical protein
MRQSRGLTTSGAAWRALPDPPARCSPRQACRIELLLTEALRAPVEVLRFEELPASFRNRIEREGAWIRGA